MAEAVLFAGAVIRSRFGAFALSLGLVMITATTSQHHRPEGHREGTSPAPGLSPAWITLIVVAVVVAAVGGRVLTHRLDRGRIGDYAQANGWELLECTWSLFGPGWFGSKNARIYRVRFRDREGRVHAAFAKTSALGGVYLTEDRIEG